MLSVLHVCTDFWPSTGGIQAFVLELSKRSRAAGVSATVLCCNRAKGHVERLAATEEVDGVPVIRAPFINLRFYKPTSFAAVTLREYDIVHVHGVGAQLDYVAMSKWAHRRPIIVSTHGAIFHTESLRWIKQQYFFRLQPFVIRRVDLVAACSRSDAELFRRVSRNVRLVENAVDVDALLALRATGKSRGRCLYVGRLAPNKGIDALMKAFAVARRNGGKFELRIVGPDSSGQRHLYEALAQDLGLDEHVRFLGTLESRELMSEYEKADLFVSASRYEGFGLSAIEARAADCRLVLQDNEAFHHLFPGDAGVSLTDYYDAESAGAALLAVLEDRADRVAGRDEMRRFSWDRKMHEWLAIYRQVAGSAKS